jgi:hypothetical protein
VAGPYGVPAAPPAIHSLQTAGNEERVDSPCTRAPRLEAIMPILTVLLTLVLVGVVLWLVNTYIPMASSIKTILNAVIVILVILWLLNVFGLVSGLNNFRMGHH